MKSNPNRSYRSLRVAVVAALVGAAGLANAGDPLTLDVTVGTDTTPGVCAATDTVNVDPGTDVNFCYTITNNTIDTYETHSLDTNFFGLLLDNVPQTLGPSESFQFNDTQNISSTTSLLADWTAVTGVTSYTQGTPAFNFIDISGTGTGLGLSDDGVAQVTMGFTFNLYGNRSTDLLIGNNGDVLFGVKAGTVGFTKLVIPALHCVP